MKKVTKYSFILTAFLFLSIIGTAQTNVYHPFATDSAQWSVDWSNTNGVHYYYFFTMRGDTIINNKTYSKVYKSPYENFGSMGEQISSFVREDNFKRMYARYPYSKFQDSSEFLLYDFNLSLNDTIIIKHDNFDNILITDSIKVLAIDSILINGNFRQRYYMGLVNGSSSYTGEEYWIEGIGSLQGLLYPELFGFFETGCTLVCYYEKGVYLIGEQNNCSTLGIKQNLDSTNKVNLYPNPSSGDIVLEIEGCTHCSSLEIYNAIGEKVKTISINSNKTTLQRSNFNAGYYVYKLFDIKNTYETGKFIIQ